jgi:CheY-like chemotaxis protein
VITRVAWSCLCPTWTPKLAGEQTFYVPYLICAVADRRHPAASSYYHLGLFESSNRSQEKGTAAPRILVVDDDTMVCVTVELCLQRQGFEVTVADGGEAGMRALESSGFDVMLIDVFMPHMRGFDSIRMFHERVPDIPIIAMSGYAFANTERAPRFPAHDRRTRRGRLPAQTVHAKHAVDLRQRMPHQNEETRAHLNNETGRQCLRSASSLEPALRSCC